MAPPVKTVTLVKERRPSSASRCVGVIVTAQCDDVTADDGPLAMPDDVMRGAALATKQSDREEREHECCDSRGHNTRRSRASDRSSHVVPPRPNRRITAEHGGAENALRGRR